MPRCWLAECLPEDICSCLRDATMMHGLQSATYCAAYQVYKWDPDREEKPSYKSYNIDINRCELAGLKAKPLSS